MLRRMIGAARLRAATFEELEKDRSATVQAMLVVLLVAVASFVGGIFGTGEIDIVGGLIFGAVQGIASWALWALFTWLIGTNLLETTDTRADWGELARGTGFAQTPGLLNLLVGVPFVGIYISWVGQVWKFASMVVAVRQCLNYRSTVRAFFVILISFLPVVIMHAVLIELVLNF